MILRLKAWLAPAAIAATFAITAVALAAEKEPKPEKLPGVEGDYGIVKSYAPEPEPDNAPTAQIDGWDISISGQVTIDIGAGNLPLPRN